MSEPPRKSGGMPLIAKIAGVVFAVFVIYVVVSHHNYYHPASSKGAAARQAKSQYAKIECENCGETNDFLFDIYSDGMQIYGLGMFTDIKNLTSQSDRQALKDAISYLKSHETLRNGTFFEISLYKHYVSEDEKDGWTFWLKYSSRDDSFSGIVCRF